MWVRALLLTPHRLYPCWAVGVLWVKVPMPARREAIRIEVEGCAFVWAQVWVVQLLALD